MARPRKDTLPIHTMYFFRELKDGTTSVFLKEYVYDRTKKTNRQLKARKIGYLPVGSQDLKDMVPVSDPKPGRKKRPAAAEAVTAENPVLDIKDPRQPEKIVYPTYLAFVVLMMCAGAGMSTTPQIAEFWKAHHGELARLFADCPERDISHDTIRDFIIILGKTQNDGVLKAFNAMLLQEEGVLRELEQMQDKDALEEFHRSIYALDGQAVRASKVESGSSHPRYVLSVYDCNKELALGQEVVGEKTNEIPHGKALVHQVDIRGGIITADAMHAQTEFVQAVLEEEADYVLGLKGNQKLTEENLKKLFSSSKYEELMACEERDDWGHGRRERRSVRVLPANLLELDILDKWPGLEEGSIVELTSTRLIESSDKKSVEVRYFISSLHFNKSYIAKQLLYVIRSHWSIENKLHWVLDVIFDQDLTQCRNNEFLKGKTVLNKIMYNFMTVSKRILEKERGKKISRQSMKPIFTNVSSFLELLAKVCIFKNK